MNLEQLRNVICVVHMNAQVQLFMKQSSMLIGQYPHHMTLLPSNCNLHCAYECPGPVIHEAEQHEKYLYLIDGFHSNFSLGNWRVLHHHAPCWLVSIHITWPFCPPVSMVKDAMESVHSIHISVQVWTMLYRNQLHKMALQKDSRLMSQWTIFSLWCRKSTASKSW